MIYTLPFIAAIIGWFTNYLAVKMLFHPKKPTTIFPGVKLQGVFPKRQKLLAKNLGRIVASELITISELKDKILSRESLGAIDYVIEDKIDNFLNHRLTELMPMISMFINENMKNSIKATLIEEFNKMLPEIIDQLSASIESKLDIEGMVEEKVAAFSSDKLEAILFSIMNKEFRFIEIIGAILGFFIGLVQLGLIYFSG